MSPSSIVRDSPSDAPPASKDGAVPSGFILKLYQMVNGAPDDIISVSFHHSSIGILFYRLGLSAFGNFCGDSAMVCCLMASVHGYDYMHATG